MSLRGLGQFAGGATTGYLKAREDFRQQDEEDRRAAERAEQDKFKADIAAAGQQATTSTNIGLGVTSADGKQKFYVPTQEAADQYAKAGYVVDQTPVSYQETNAGSRAVGLGQYAGTEDPRAQQTAVDYNEGTSDRMRGIAMRAGRFQDAAALEALGTADLRKEGLKLGNEAARGTIEAQKTSRDLIQKEIEGRPILADLQSQLAATKAGTPEYAALRQQLIAAASQYYDPTKAAQIVLHTTQMSQADRAERQAQVADRFHDAVLKGKQGLVDFYRQEMPDGWDVKEVPIKGGGFKLVQYNTETKKTGADIGTFKDEKDLRVQAMMKAPTLLGAAMTLQEKRDEKDTWAEVTKYVAGLKANRSEYQTNSFEYAGSDSHGQPVFTNKAAPGLFYQGNKPVPADEAVKITQRKSGEKAPAVDAIEDSMIKGIATGAYTPEQVNDYRLQKSLRNAPTAPQKTSATAPSPSDTPVGLGGANPDVQRAEIQQRMAQLSELQDPEKHPEIPEATREIFRTQLRGLGMRLRDTIETR